MLTCNVVTLPTNQENYLGNNHEVLVYANGGNGPFNGKQKVFSSNVIAQHLYFTTDEYPTTGDWVIINELYNDGVTPLLAKVGRLSIYNMEKGDMTFIVKYSNGRHGRYHPSHLKGGKVVATSNPELWHNVPGSKTWNNDLFNPSRTAKIGTDFIREYVSKQGKIKEVTIESLPINIKRATLDGFPDTIGTPEFLKMPIIECDFLPRINNDGEVIVV